MKVTTQSSQSAKSANKNFSKDSKEAKLIIRLKLEKRKSEISERKDEREPDEREPDEREPDVVFYKERLPDSNTVKQIYEDFDEIWFAIERLKKNLIR
jgi:hypothetical protein